MEGNTNVQIGVDVGICCTIVTVPEVRQVCVNEAALRHIPESVLLVAEAKWRQIKGSRKRSTKKRCIVVGF
jgi:ubiquitin C-terminal hydrolase